MDQQNQNMCAHCDQSGKCTGKYHCHGHILRWVLFAFVLMMVFSCGVKIGEFKAELGGDYGYRQGGMMRGGYGYQPMMYQGGWVTSTQTAPATTVKK